MEMHPDEYFLQDMTPHELHETFANDSSSCLPWNTKEPDMYLKVEGTFLPVHKAVLSFYSQIFKTLICGRTKLEASSSGMEVIVLKEHNLDDIKELLEFLYSQEKDLTDENVINLLSLAEEFLILILLEMCEEYLLSSKTFDVLLLLRLGRKHRLLRLVEHALSEASKIPQIEQRVSFFSLDECEQTLIMRRVIERFRKASNVISGCNDTICALHKRFPDFPFCFNCSCVASTKNRKQSSTIIAKQSVAEAFDTAFSQDLD